MANYTEDFETDEMANNSTFQLMWDNILVQMELIMFIIFMLNLQQIMQPLLYILLQ